MITNNSSCNIYVSISMGEQPSFVSSFVRAKSRVYCELVLQSVLPKKNSDLVPQQEFMA